MIDDIEDGKINCVVTKDLSRLGRNYILTGQYTEHSDRRKRKEEQTMKKFIIIGSAVVTAVTAAVIIIVRKRK